MIRRNFRRLLDKYLNDTASPEERAFLEAWFEALQFRQSTRPPFTEEELEKLKVEMLNNIQKKIEELRLQRFGPHNQGAGLLHPDQFQGKYIELIKHPSPPDILSRTILSADDICFRPMIECLSTTYRQTIIWSQFDKLSLHEIAIRLRLTTSGARSRLQRAQEKLIILVRRCCTYQYDNSGQPLSCIIRHIPGCCEFSASD